MNSAGTGASVLPIMTGAMNTPDRTAARSRFVRPLAAAALLAAAPAWAQTADEPAPPAGPVGATANVAPVELSDTPAVVDSLGLSLFLPLGASVQTTIISGGRTLTRVQPAEARWLMQIFNSISSDTELTPAQALDAVVAQRQAQFRAGGAAAPDARSLIRQVSRTDNLVLGGLPASRVYLKHALNPDFPISGYTVVRTAPGQFIFFQIDYPPANAEDAFSVYETVVAAAEFRDPAEVNSDRTAAVLAGKAFLESINAADLEAAFHDEPVYYRIFRPATTNDPRDAQEVGYQKVETRIGQIGELDLQKPEVAWSVADREFGHILEITARTLRGDTIIDSRAAFFLSRDRETELWSIVMQQRTASGVAQSRQTLARRGEDLTIMTDAPGAPPVTRDFALLEGHYIPRVTLYLLPRLIARQTADDEQALYNLGFYHFDPGMDRVTLRRDTFERTDGGAWLVRTTPSEGRSEWVATHSPEGDLIRRNLSPIQVLEPTTLERLRSLWRSKGLPMD